MISINGKMVNTYIKNLNLMAIKLTHLYLKTLFIL